MIYFFLLSALAGFTVTLGHGVQGHRSVISPLAETQLSSSFFFGDPDMTRRVLIVVWHMVTMTFLGSAICMLLIGLGKLRGDELAVLVTALHGAFALLGVIVISRREARMLRLGTIFFFSMVALVAIMGVLGITLRV